MTHNDLPHRSLSRRIAALLLTAVFLTPGVPPSAEGAGSADREASAQSAQRRAPSRSPRSPRRDRSTALATTPWGVPTGAGALNADLSDILGASVRNGQWGVLVVSLTRGDTLYSVNPDEMLQPASSMRK